MIRFILIYTVCKGICVTELKGLNRMKGVEYIKTFLTEMPKGLVVSMY